MIFVTIGTQAPFDRFIKAMDEIAGLIEEPVIAQICKGEYKVKNMIPFDYIPPDEFKKLFSEARLIVSHAGIGTILSALVDNKPIIVMPRIAALGEHRNEHQLATCKEFEKLGYINVAYNEKELKNLILDNKIKVLHFISTHAPIEFINEIRNTIILLSKK
jgi:UDP-N-acetylglucosamine transferase subunit ALG13